MLKFVHQFHILWGVGSHHRSINFIENLVGDFFVQFLWLSAYWIFLCHVEHHGAHSFRLFLLVNYILNSIPFNLGLVFFCLICTSEGFKSQFLSTLFWLTWERAYGARAWFRSLLNCWLRLFDDLCFHDYNVLIWFYIW